jgi:flagellar hook-associated protein 2
MAGIQLTGLASGMDTTAIISQLMAVERLPRTSIENNQSLIQARRNNLADIQSKLNALKLATQDLGSVLSWNNTQSVGSSDATKVTATLKSGAGPGGYDLSVANLASSARATYTFDSTAEQTFTIKDADGAQTGTFTVAAGGSLDDLVAEINSKPEAGVFAVNVKGDLVLSSRTTGEQSNFTVDGRTPVVGSAVAGVDASFTINGIAATSATNVVTDAIPGLELTLKAKTDSTTITVGAPGPDTSVVKSKLKAFVDAYNTALTTMNNALGEKRVANPAGASDAAKGSLFGDTGVRDMLDGLRTAVGSPIAIPGFNDGPQTTNLTLLAQLGISTGAANTSTTIDADAVAGKLKFDEAAFDTAYAKDPVGVQKLLGGVIGTDGVSQQLSKRIAAYTDTDGVLAGRLSSVDMDLTSIKDRLARFDDRLATRQAYYERQFSMLETALANSQSLGNQMAAQLNALNSSR